MFFSKKILILSILAILSLSASAGGSSMFLGPIVSEKKDKTMDLEILVNANSKIVMKNVPTEGYLEVYSIIGVLVKRVNLKQYTVSCPLDLPKGVYILKAGKVTQKTFAR